MTRRIVFLDYVRVFACFLVMLVHASENYYGAPGSTDMAGPQSFLANETDRFWVSLYDGFSRMSVPLFMIVSAFLLVPVREGMSMVEFYRRRAVRILPAFLLSSCMPYLSRFFGELWGQCFWNEFHMLWYFSGYLGYLVLAHYIRVHLDWSRARRLAVGSVAMAVGAVWTILSFYLQAVPGQLHATPVLEIGWSFCTINCVLLTSGAFLLFSCIRATSTPKWIAEMSNLSYGMYLMHILWLGFCVSIFKDRLQLPTGIAIPVIAVATFVCSLVATKILSVLPFCSWMAGVKRQSPRNRAAVLD